MQLQMCRTGTGIGLLLHSIHFFSLMVYWLPPSFRILKINFDAFVVTDKAAAGYVIRGHNAKLKQVGGKLLLSSSTPFA